MTNSINTQETIKITQAKNITDALKIAKKAVSNHRHPHSSRLLIAFNGNEFMAIGQSGITVAIASCKFNNDHSFIAIIPLVKNGNKEIGFTAFQNVITSQKITDKFSYSIAEISTDASIEPTLVCESLERKSVFKFNILDNENDNAFPLTTDLSLILENFMIKNQVTEVNEVSKISLTDKKSKNHICFDGIYEYFDYDSAIYKADRTNVIDRDNQVRSGSIYVATHTYILDSIKHDKSDFLLLYPSVIAEYLKDLYEVTEVTEVTEATEVTEVTEVMVPGVGNIPLIGCKALQVGMYLYFDSLIYTISNIEKVDFINHKASYIVTVASLINAIDYKKIILDSDALIAAWLLNFEKSIAAKKAVSVAIAKQDAKQDATDPLPVESSDISLPKRVRAATHDRGIKGNGRDMLLKMLSSGATLDQVMSSFNWSHKTASNHTTYVKQWGYNLERKGNIYQIV